MLGVAPTPRRSRADAAEAARRRRAQASVISIAPSQVLHLVAAVRAAGGWKAFVTAPHKDVLAFRSLRARGRAVAHRGTPAHLDRLTSPSLPDGVLWTVLSFWRDTR